MFEFTSRYYHLDTATLAAPGGRVVAYKRRRFLPDGQAMPLLLEVTVAQGDRLDRIAAATLGDPEQFWWICDANNILDPLELTAEPGKTVRVPIPEPPGARA